MKIRSTSNVEYHIVVKMSTAIEPGQPGNGLFLWIHFLRCCGRFCENSKSWRLNKCWVKLATSLKTNPKRTSPGCFHKIYEMLQNYQCPPPFQKLQKIHSSLTEGPPRRRPYVCFLSCLDCDLYFSIFLISTVCIVISLMIFNIKFECGLDLLDELW